MSDDLMNRLNAALRGRYRIEHQLGEGGMATVYLADDLRHERTVALKVLKPELAAVVGTDRFLAEIKTTAKLQHPHILPLFDSGEAEGFLFYVMPYVAGESLREKLDREHQLPVEEAVRIAADVAEALEYAHGHGVIHRDVKPANILLHAGRPLIADFGIALAVGAAGGGRLTETGLSLGTPHYMSPEQATSDQHVGAATDIYALGCVLYEMLVGEPPYTGGTPQAILGKIITGGLEPAGTQRSSVPANVDAVIAKALERVPADRFRSANAIAEALADPGFTHGTVARSSRVAETRSPAFRLATGWALVSTILLVVAITSNAGGRDRPALRASINLSADAGVALIQGSVLALSPDGGTLAYVADAEPTHLDVRPLDRAAAVPLAGTDGAIQPFFSPDGSWIAFFSGDQLKRVPVGGGEVQIIVESLPSTPLGASWADDGTILFGTRRDGVLRVVETGGAPVPVAAPVPEEGDVWFAGPTLVDDEMLLVTLSAGGSAAEKRIEAISLPDGERRVLVEEAYDARLTDDGHLLFGTVGGLAAQQFDTRSMELIGDPIRVLEGVQLRSVENVVDYALSPNGALVWLAARPADPDTLVWVDRDGSSSPIRAVPSAVQFATLSPAEDRVALSISNVDGMGIWMVDLGIGALQPLDVDPSANHLPVWTHDGTRIVFSSRRPGGPDLYWRRSDGSGVAQPFHLSQFHKDGGSWHQATGLFAFSEHRPDTLTGWDIWVHSADSTPAAWPLIETDVREYQPMISPDGSLLAFVSERTGRPEVNLTPFPSGGPIRQVSTGGGDNPLWARDGRELFYQVGDSVMLVEVPDRSVSGMPRLLFRAPFAEARGFGAANYAVTSSGRFLMIRQGHASSPQTEIGVVTEFLAELRERF